MTNPRWAGFSRLRMLGVVAIMAQACVACSGKSAPVDDSAKVTSSIQHFGHELVVMGYLKSAPQVRIGDCATWAPVTWSAPLRWDSGQPTTQRERHDMEQNVLGQANLFIRLGQQRIIRSVQDDDPGSASVDQSSEPAVISVNADRTTELTVTVPRGDYVRVDGYVSCRSAKD